MESFVELSAPRYSELSAGADAFESFSVMQGVPAVVVVPGRAPSTTAAAPSTTAFATVPCIVIAVGDNHHLDALRPVCDLALTTDEFERYGEGLHDGIGASPMAAVALAIHLRSSGDRSIADGLITESTLYSLLQSGPEFRRWLEHRPVATPTNDPDEPVTMERIGDELRITLNRPHRHNAFSRAMRDAMCGALELVSDDPAIGSVVLNGAGPSFCSGGELAEFGTFASPVGSHLTRLTRSPARLLAANSSRVTAHLHGACYGAGIELPAFAHRVTAHPDTRFRLPELGLGLIPGAGGTVSLPRRIGRHRTALLGLSQSVISAETAHRWGLVDQIVELPGR